MKSIDFWAFQVTPRTSQTGSGIIPTIETQSTASSAIMSAKTITPSERKTTLTITTTSTSTSLPSLSRERLIASTTTPTPSILGSKSVQNQLSTEKVLKRNFNASAWLDLASESLSDLTCHEMNQELLNLTIVENERCDKQALDFAREESLKLSTEKDELIKNNLLLDNALCSKISKKYVPFGFENLMPQLLKNLCGDLQGNLEKYHAFKHSDESVK